MVNAPPSDRRGRRPDRRTPLKARKAWERSADEGVSWEPLSIVGLRRELGRSSAVAPLWGRLRAGKTVRHPERGVIYRRRAGVAVRTVSTRRRADMASRVVVDGLGRIRPRRQQRVRKQRADGRRNGWQRRRRPEVPGLSLRRAMRAEGMRYCSWCAEFLPWDEVDDDGLCQGHARRRREEHNARRRREAGERRAADVARLEEWARTRSPGAWWFLRTAAGEFGWSMQRAALALRAVARDGRLETKATNRDSRRWRWR